MTSSAIHQFRKGRPLPSAAPAIITPHLSPHTHTHTHTHLHTGHQNSTFILYRLSYACISHYTHIWTGLITPESISTHTCTNMYTRTIITHFKPHSPALTLSSRCHSMLPITEEVSDYILPATKQDITQAMPPTTRTQLWFRLSKRQECLSNTFYKACILYVLHYDYLLGMHNISVPQWRLLVFQRGEAHFWPTE